MRLRFSIASLLAAIAFCGISLAALRSGFALWASAMFTTVVAVFSAAILGAMASRGRPRLSWAGLAVFGWIYLAVAFGPWPFNADGPPPLLTVPLLESIQDALFSDGKDPYLAEDRRSPQDRVMNLRGNVGPVTGNLMRPPPPAGYRTVSLIQYRQVGHTVGAAVFGLIGALLGWFFAVHNEAADRREDGA
jgi:hypothetical protein